MSSWPNVESEGVRAVSAETLQTMVQRLVDAIQPEEIILFGSHAYGAPRPESDIDLLVIMNSDLPRRERRKVVDRALGRIPGLVDVHVYTPQEIVRALSIGNFFVREMVTRGRVLYARGPLCHPSGHAGPVDLTFAVGGEVDDVTDPLAWAAKAEDDYTNAQSVLRRKRPLTGISCFHSQQCVEKYFKALLVSLGQGFPKLHDLVELAEFMEANGIIVPISMLSV
jgi:predicted nucleotidyltransferase